MVLIFVIGLMIVKNQSPIGSAGLAQINPGVLNKVLYNPKIINVKKVTWAGHLFETGVLSTRQYKIDGNKGVQVTNSGFYAPSWAMPRSRLLDVNPNQKVKVTISGIFEGELESQNPKCTGSCMTTPSYHFSEFSIYLIDEDGNARGVSGMGTRDNVTGGNKRNQYKFTELTVENTGKEIIITNSSGLKLVYSKDLKYVTSDGHTELHRGADYGQINPNQNWNLRINCHVNGEGYCKLDIKDIKVD